MEQWRLVADSSCDLSPEEFGNEQLPFSTVPLIIRVGDTEYLDIPSTDTKRMLTHMKENKGPSSSACPSPEAFAEEFCRAANSIAVTVTSSLSGTYNCAVQAMRMVLEQHPEKKIHIVNSNSTSGSMILLLRKLKELIQQDIAFEEIVEQIEKYRNDMRILFSLASFDNLVKSGRMSRAAGVLDRKSVV